MIADFINLAFVNIKIIAEICTFMKGVIIDPVK